MARIARTQPQAAYTVLTQGLSSRWTYLLRCQSCPQTSLEGLDGVLTDEFIPSMIGHQFASDSAMRELLSLPVRCGGLAIPRLAHGHLQSIRHLSHHQALVGQIVGQSARACQLSTFVPCGPVLPPPVADLSSCRLLQHRLLVARPLPSRFVDHPAALP